MKISAHVKTNARPLYRTLSNSVIALSTLSLALSITLSTTGCSAKKSELFLESGSIVVSRQMPSANDVVPTGGGFGPIVGYLPPTQNFIPAENEPWLSISSATKEVALMVGGKSVQQFRAEGAIGAAPGSYALQRKERNPVWYAPDQYFERRMLEVPAESDRTRYRRGALGSLAMYLAPNAVIHSALVCSEEVGGLKMEEGELTSLFESLPLGASVVVK